MLQYILTNLILASVGAILFIIVRALPRIDEEPDAERKQTFVERIIMSDIPHRFDLAMNGFLGKFFRKMKVYLMRLDNYLTNKLKTMNTDSGPGPVATPTEFIKEMSGPIEDAVERSDNSSGSVLAPAGNGKTGKNGKR